ncbi:MAG: phosphate ABC transporter ATP-binding protein PstB [Acidimicrobiia bacterium]
MTVPSVTSVPAAAPPAALSTQGLGVYYGDWLAVADITMKAPRHHITAFIGPSGCGKSTLLRCFNRMNDLIADARVVGSVRYGEVDLYDERIDPVQVRRRIGMVFQRPNPFPKSVYDNVAYGLRVHGMHDDLDARVEDALRRAALWDEVRSGLKKPALALSGGQQQRLCIARTIAIEPDIVLMDEPCSALDPIATGRIEDLMQELRRDYTILIVTHNMQQAARASDYAAFLTTEVDGESDRRRGKLVEFAATNDLFTSPQDPRTENYITGRFG